jgi:hypothetical protein
LEKIFIRIAETIDGRLPSGDNWHSLLLEQMMGDVLGVRPAVISNETGRILRHFRKFRHVVRNVYTYKFNPEKVGELVGFAQTAFQTIVDEIQALADFLEH